MKNFIILIIFVLTLPGIIFGQSEYDFSKGQIYWSKLNYPLINGTSNATITVRDYDMNISPEHMDSVLVRVYSESYPEGLILQVYETGKNEGYFEKTFVLSNVKSDADVLLTSSGEKLTAEYLDYTVPLALKNESLSLKSTAFAGNLQVDSEKIETSKFRVEDLQRNEISNKIKGLKQIQLTYELSNPYNKPSEFIYLVQIKDNSEQVVSLSWLQGTIMPLQIINTSISWNPNEKGEYKAMAFVWKSLEEPTPLSPPMVLDISLE
jgi:hypothetical protein